MKLLDSRNYKKVIPIIQSAGINTMFALSVLERKVEGKVFIDEEASPVSFYIQHPYGMALLYGETNKEDFYVQLASYMLNVQNVRNEFEWLQVYPASLYSKMEAILGSNLIKKNPNEPYKKSLLVEEDNKVLEYQRINFGFNKEKFLAVKKRQTNMNYKIVTTSEAIFNQLDGSVVPKYFWNNYNDFMKNGIGFTIFSENDHPASTAFAAFIIDDQLEIGIETCERNQGSGFGSIVCTELIDYCMANGYKPVWSCHSGNIGSRKLAHKLGFEEATRVPYYRLPK
ncbi:GNAT family N-acetyltransferase [Paenibacillus sp. 1-18]|uniref:GNAT family N-acetyltransferase n=1 Tax=Paenibacillus sp. 1-18 TaxID=1333846 RepID=UPI00046F1511|nr:GNAT family N-acetyltransferase [Paenibacillus sp. 1-18]